MLPTGRASRIWAVSTSLVAIIIFSSGSKARDFRVWYVHARVGLLCWHPHVIPRHFTVVWDWAAT